MLPVYCLLGGKMKEMGKMKLKSIQYINPPLGIWFLYKSGNNKTKHIFVLLGHKIITETVTAKDKIVLEIIYIRNDSSKKTGTLRFFFSMVLLPLKTNFILTDMEDQHKSLR